MKKIIISLLIFIFLMQSSWAGFLGIADDKWAHFYWGLSYTAIREKQGTDGIKANLELALLAVIKELVIDKGLGYKPDANDLMATILGGFFSLAF